jgi:hypothetical protein
MIENFLPTIHKSTMIVHTAKERGDGRDGQKAV